LGKKRLPKIIAVVGPTASGKSELAVTLAKRLNGEIISADSRQIYLGMDIGTAKVSSRTRSVVPHHMLDLLRPDEHFSVHDYYVRALECVKDISAREKTPIVVGGSGEYISCLTQGLMAASVPSDDAIRDRLSGELKRDGLISLVSRLSRLDPVRAEQIDAKNPHRVIRALEIIEMSGTQVPIQTRQNPQTKSITLGIGLSADERRANIERRTEDMFTRGLVDEVRALMANGYCSNSVLRKSIGYAQVCGYLVGEISLRDCVQKIKVATNAYARRQGTWFRNQENVVWIQKSELMVQEVLQRSLVHIQGES